MSAARISPGDAIRIMEAACEHSRMKALLAIAETPDITSKDLVKATGLSQPTCSHSLGVLRTAGLVDSCRDGQFMKHRVIPTQFMNLANFLLDTFGE